MDPCVSVVVPVYNGRATLEACLDALERQDYEAPWEIVVVDNGSTDGSGLVARGRRRTRLVRCLRPGPAAARNEGVAAARYGLIAFTDADCVPEAGWLSALTAGLTSDLAGVGGPVLSLSGGAIAEYVAESSFRQQEHVTAQLPYLATANALYRRKAVEAIGGFDEGFELAGGEDNDLGWRLNNAGYRIGFVSSARCRHHHPTTLLDLVSQRVRYGYGEWILVEKHRHTKAARDLLGGGSFWQTWIRLCEVMMTELLAWRSRGAKRMVIRMVAEAAFLCGYALAIWRGRRRLAPGRACRPSDGSGEPSPQERGPTEPTRAQRELMCLKAWTSFELDDQRGNVLPCCWTKVTVGNVNEESIEEIWNGSRFQDFRRRMLEGRYEEICPAHCPYRTGSFKERLPTEGVTAAFKTNVEHLRSDVAEGRVHVTGLPVTLRLLPSIRCNLECIMCWQRVEQDAELPNRFYEDVRALLPTARSITLQGGEPLMIRRCRELLASAKAASYPDLGVGIITNGTFLSDKFLDSVEGVEFNWLFVSLDAATPETYRRIRGADLPSVLDRVRLVQRRRPDIRLILGFVVMAENVEELISFVQLAEELGADFDFSPLNAAFKKGNDFAKPEFRHRLALKIEETERYLEGRGWRNLSLETVKHRMWNSQFRWYREAREAVEDTA